MSGWERATWRDDNAMFLDTEHGRAFVMRHGEGRKYWGVTYPDGTYTHNALTQAEAKAQAEAWKPDATLVELVSQDELTAELDEVSTTDDATSTKSQQELPSRDRWWASVIDGAAVVEVPRRYYSYNAPGEAQRRALGALAELAKVRREVENHIKAQVAIARTNTSRNWSSNGATWEQIGHALGISKQGASSRYGKAS